jgi:hypothetical protein
MSRFAHLSREQKIELLQAAEEKRRRDKLARPPYIPNPGQLEIHKDGESFRKRFVFSGNSFGKTALLINEVFWAAQGFNPFTNKTTKVPAKIYVVLDSPEKIADKFIPEARKWFVIDEDEQFHKDGKPYISRITFKNGSVIRFLFFDMDEYKFEGIDGIDFFASDEPLPRRVYLGMYRGLREKDSDPRVLVCGTPIGQPWLRTEVWEPWSKGDLSDTKCYRYSSDTNRANLREGYLEEYFGQMNAKEREIRRSGAFFDLEGLALAHLFRAETHLVEPFEIPPDWPCVIAIDPHYSKKHIACLVTTDRDGSLYYIKEYASRSPADEFAEELKQFYSGFRIIDIVADSLGSAMGTGGRGNLSFIEVLREHGVQVRATTYSDKYDESFIDKIQQVLIIPEKADNFGRKLPKLRIFRNCFGIIGDVNNVEWLKYKGLDEYKPKLNITSRDYLATLKYALATSITFLPGKPKVIKSAKPSPWSGKQALSKTRLHFAHRLRGGR